MRNSSDRPRVPHPPGKDRPAEPPATYLPTAEATSRKELTLHIDADGNAHHDGESLTTEQLQTLLQKEHPALLVLRADRSASSGQIKQIIDAATAAVEGIRFALKAPDPAADLPAAEALAD